VLELELLLYPERLLKWSRKHHGAELRACQFMARRAPLILLEGDVGCGKTALAETVGDRWPSGTGARSTFSSEHQVRGTGMVGEMTDLIVQAFSLAEARADALATNLCCCLSTKPTRWPLTRRPTHAPRGQSRAEYAAAAN